MITCASAAEPVALDRRSAITPWPSARVGVEDRRERRWRAGEPERADDRGEGPPVAAAGRAPRRAARRRPRRAATAPARARTSRRAACGSASMHRIAPATSAVAATTAERALRDRSRPGREHEQQRDERHEERRARPAAGRARPRDTAGPASRCSTAEISRSMYIAASTIATRADDRVAPAACEDARPGSGTRRRTPPSPARRAR